MPIHRYRLKLMLPILILVLFLISGCARNSYVNVNYRLPLSSNVLEGKSVFLQVKDLRSDTAVFSETAKTNFEYFTGLFSLKVENQASERRLMGAYDLQALFREAFEQRLKTMGITIADTHSPSIPDFTITLNRFLIDLKGRQWIADVSYDASLTTDNQLIARESVSGSAERLKLVGKRDAEKIIGAIFTETINKLDITRLFEEARI
ncbi:MAG: hypothetical protein HKM93_03120 [Desulfobacteraceae bacterium]|nr:hypothetical protein [Desulfobacteraceae bacterium]